MEVPNGYDLFEHNWPPDIVSGDITVHPQHRDFIELARKNGFDTDSGGFKESEKGYFLFFLLGHNGYDY